MASAEAASEQAASESRDAGWILPCVVLTMSVCVCFSVSSIDLSAFSHLHGVEAERAEARCP